MAETPVAAEAISVVQICNMALTQVGESTITSLADDNKRARLCDSRYTDVRDSVLRAHPWGSATKRAGLSLLVSTPAYGYDNEFQLPTDWLRIVQPELRDVEFKIEGRKLLTNESEFNCTYIYRLEDVTEMDPLLRAAIAARLAAELGLPLARSAERQQNLWQQYQDKLSEARFHDSAGHSVESFDTDQWLASRIGSSGTYFRSIPTP